MSSPLAVLGGLFDPVHRGHVAAARFALETLQIERIKMIPCRVPNHKGMPSTPAEHRLAMLEIATASCSQIEIDPIELRRDRVSYTVDTLSELKSDHETLVFVLGVDSFNSLPQWHDWRNILKLSHLLVLSRHGSSLSAETLAAVDIDARRVANREELFASRAGKILLCENFDVDMASSGIRRKLMQGADVSAELDAGVVLYIRQNGLYQD